MNVLLAAAGAAAVVILFLWWRRSRLRRKEREAPMYAWIASVENAPDDAELAELPDPKHWWRGEGLAEAVSRRSGALQRVQQAKKQRDKEAAQARHLAVFNAIWEKPPAERCTALANFCWYYLEDRAEPRQRALEFFQEYTAVLYAKAKEGDSKSFWLLFELVRLDDPRDRSVHDKATGNEYQFPEDWDEQLVRFVRMPNARDFHNQPPIGRASVQAVVPQALSGNEIGHTVLAKWVLAVTRGDDDDSRGMRRAVGEVFHAELLRHVHRYHTSVEGRVIL